LSKLQAVPAAERPEFIPVRNHAVDLYRLDLQGMMFAAPNQKWISERMLFPLCINSNTSLIWSSGWGWHETSSFSNSACRPSY